MDLVENLANFAFLLRHKTDLRQYPNLMEKNIESVFVYSLHFPNNSRHPSNY